MRDVETDMFRAFSKVTTCPWTVAQAFGMLGRGELRLWVGEHMSSSAFVADGVVKIMHVGGSWDDAEARWMLDGLQEYAAEKGLPWQWAGRLSWPRFLKMKGMI
jgi:hypothetical protein